MSLEYVENSLLALECNEKAALELVLCITMSTKTINLPHEYGFEKETMCDNDARTVGHVQAHGGYTPLLSDRAALTDGAALSPSQTAVAPKATGADS